MQMRRHEKQLGAETDREAKEDREGKLCMFHDYIDLLYTVVCIVTVWTVL